MDLLQLNKTTNASYKIELRFDWSEARFHTVEPKHSLTSTYAPSDWPCSETKPTALKEQHVHRIVIANEAKSAILYSVVLVEIESRVPTGGPPPKSSRTKQRTYCTLETWHSSQLLFKNRKKKNSMAYRLFKNYTLTINIYFVVKNIFSALVGKYLKWYSCIFLLKIPNYFSAQFTRNCKVRIEAHGHREWKENDNKKFVPDLLCIRVICVWVLQIYLMQL